MSVALVLPAAGSGSRCGGEPPKQLQDLCGAPVLARTLAAFAGLVDHAVVAVSEEVEPAVATLLHDHDFGFPVHGVRGGATRQASVYAAIRATPTHCDRLLIHDAARPLIPRACIAACIAALTEHRAAVLALPCHSTVKRAADTHPPLVAATVPREGLWLAQTPQALHRDLALEAFAAAERDGITGTDDVQLVERLGVPVALLPGHGTNFKITTAEDLEMARALWTGGDARG